MTDDDERQILTLIRSARVLGVFSCFAGLLGLYALFQTPSHIMANVLMLMACAVSFYLAWLCIFDGTKIIRGLEAMITVREKRKADWIAKTSTQQNTGDNRQTEEDAD